VLHKVFYEYHSKLEGFKGCRGAGDPGTKSAELELSVPNIDSPHPYRLSNIKHIEVLRGSN